MRVAVAHGKYPDRELIARGMAHRLKVLGYREVEVLAYKFMEDVLDTDLNYDVFVCYSNFGKHLGGIEGASILHAHKPDAHIIGVTTMYPKVSRFREAGALAIVFPGADEVAQICDAILKHVPPPITSCPKSRARPIQFVEGRKTEGELVWLYACPDCKLNCLISLAPRTRLLQGRPISPEEAREIRQSGENIFRAMDVLADQTEIKWLP